WCSGSLVHHGSSQQVVWSLLLHWQLITLEVIVLKHCCQLHLLKLQCRQIKDLLQQAAVHCLSSFSVTLTYCPSL
ncbi:hypothetical protein PO909_020474, partial [Leuciscus waleckii]